MPQITAIPTPKISKRVAYTNGGTLRGAERLPGLGLACGRGLGTGGFLASAGITVSEMRVGGELGRLPRVVGGVAVGSWLLGLLAIELTFSRSRFGFGNSNISTAARPFFPGWRVFDCGVLLVLGFLGLIADRGSDKKSCVVNSSEDVGELAPILLPRPCCSGKVAGSGDRISELPFCGCEGRRRPELPDWLALPDLGCFEPELGEDIDEDITDNIDPLGNRSATSYSFITTVNFKFKIFQLASQSILDFRF
ncbi:hypothetical protein NDI43_05925 [Microcoleus vaginatus GB2-A3]